MRPENMGDGDVSRFLRRMSTDLTLQGGVDTATMKQAREMLDVVRVHGHRLAHALAQQAKRDAAETQKQD